MQIWFLLLPKASLWLTLVWEVLTLPSSWTCWELFNPRLVCFWENVVASTRKISLAIWFSLLQLSVERELLTIIFLPKFLHYLHLCCSVPFLHPSVTKAVTIGPVPYIPPTAVSGNMMMYSKNIWKRPGLWQLIWKLQLCSVVALPIIFLPAHYY